MDPAAYINSSQHIIEVTGKLNMFYTLPQLILSAGGIVTMIISAFPGAAVIRRWNMFLAVIFFAAAAAASAVLAGYTPAEAFNGMVRSDLFTGMLNVIYSATGLLVTLTVHSYFVTRGRYVYEIYPLFLFSAAGMMFMTSGNDMMVIFLGLEILSVSLYVLTGIDTADTRSNEASVKYFLMGVFASAFLLYGIAFLYGSTGTTSLKGISAIINSGTARNNIYISAAVVLLLAGFGFKASMVPFHMWTPDVYQGSPLVVTAFISTAPKAAALITLIRTITVISPDIAAAGWLPGLISFLAVITMITGNLMALNQTDIKRILAFSSIAHIGYMLIAFATFRTEAAGPVLFYFVSYILMNTGLFAILSIVARNGDRNLTLEGIRGLARNKPLFGIFLVIFTFSLAGLPPTAGFPAKFFIFSTAVESGLYRLAVIGILNSAISAYYYLRILLNAYINDPDGEAEYLATLKINAACFAVILVTFAGTLWLGVHPSEMIELARKAVLSL